MFSLNLRKFLKYKQKQDGPPDLDEIARKIKKHIMQTLGFKEKAGRSTSSQKRQGNWGVIFIGLIILIIWTLSGIFIVSPAEQAAILRFGKYVKTVGPGPHWVPRFISSHYTVNVQSISTFPYQAEMLTKDENIVSVTLAVQYRIDNVRDYLFKVVNPNESLQQATASALRQVIGRTTLDEILTVGRAAVRDAVSEQIKQTLEAYHAGLLVTDVTLQPARPPEQVTAAFDDAIKAREDEQRYINQAQAYAKRKTATAEGQAARIMQEAYAAKQKAILNAQAATAAFLALLPEYKNAPLVTRERMYLETVEFMLSHSSKILVDVKNGNPLLYLPLDKLLEKNPLSLPQKTATQGAVSLPGSSDAGLLEESEDDSSAERFSHRTGYDLDTGDNR